MKNYRPIFFWLFFVLLIFAAAFSLPSAQTAASGFPPRPTDIPTATPELPTSTPNVPTTPDPVATPYPDRNEGALIYLHVSSPPPGLNTVVQWQDGLGEWHDVAGWQGELNEANFIVWWVAPKDLGAIWYRWQVYAADGRLQATSDAFSLPGHANQSLHILLNLDEK